MRSKIVKRKTLNEIADKMGLDILLSKFSLGKLSNSMKGNALEALVGAIYIEKGYRKTKNYLIYKILTKYLDIHELENLDDNFKSQLLEWGQKEGKNIEFRMISKYKLEKRDRFKIGVFVNGKEISLAEEYNKKSAEQMAAKTAMNKLDL
jgi:ribonuclease-3